MLPCLLVVGNGGVARAGGVGDKALRMTVSVNGLGSGGQRPVAVRAGGEVVKRYRLENRGEADLYGIRVRDPGVPAGAVRCPRRVLGALGTMECVARFRALPGDRRAAVRAEGDVPSLGRTLAATASAGYVGVSGALALTERAAPGPRSDTAVVAYTVTNHGNRPLHDVRLADPGLKLAGRDVACGARAGIVPRLAPGASARCTATVRRPPGVHRSTGVATGTDRVATYAPDGRLVPAPLLTARASASFTVPEEERKRERGVVGGGGGGASGAGGTGGTGGTSGTGGAPGAAGAPGAPGTAAAPPLASGVFPVGPPAPDPVPEGEEGGAPAAPPDGTGGREVEAAAPEAVPPVVREGSAVPATPPAKALPTEVPPPEVPPTEAPQQATGVVGDEGFLGRLRRRGREADEMGVVVMLLLLLVPAALAAALLGNRRS
ncbi:hypothetical protein [Streptomyces sp. CC208A]|uniref:hypothetical protein n=1 Tax=Streptomyces sp. CC208A TaxID=3044573 RepID=UPI0024A93BD5|nr:hypothetical protein [Streptomyces sp. CC208A]